MRLFLITGFLGSGKTTFLKRLLAMPCGEKPAVIVNEFGRIGLDGALLHSQGAEITEITGGSIFCSCRMDAFEDALKKTAAAQPSVIFVEASGLSDPTAVKTVVEKQPNISYAGCVALCDALRIDKALLTLRVCAKQLAVADLILLNKSDLITPKECERLTEALRRRFAQARVEPTTQGTFQENWMEALRGHAETVPFEGTRDITLQKACISISPRMTLEQLTQFLRLFAEDTYRVKGVVTLLTGVYLADCVGAALSVTRYQGAPPESANTLVALAGKGMALRKALLRAREWYDKQITNISFG